MYNVANAIITDRKMYRCFFKVSFYFRGSLYGINILLTLFPQIEVSIVLSQMTLSQMALSQVTIYLPHIIFSLLEDTY